MKKQSPIVKARSSVSRILSHAEYAPWIGLVLRLFLAWFLPWLLDNGRWLPGVSYTDIDFLVFTDAAEYLRRGMSPYDRHTYRYTPFLAELLSRLPSKDFGRYLFCVADALCGYIILHERRARRKNSPERQRDDSDDNGSFATPEMIDALLWLYNPLAINICTRGSAESLMVLLPVLLTFWIATKGEREDQQAKNENDSGNDGTSTYMQILAAGMCHGAAIHSKLYPVIYSISYMAYFATSPRNGEKPSTSNIVPKTSTFPWKNPKKLLRLAKLWIGRLFFSPKPLVFLFSFLITFAFLTWLAVYIYGDIALQEGLLYHFSRVDHRHNYSMYWYWIYLARARVADAETAKSTATAMASTVGATVSPEFFSLATLGRYLLLPQAFLLAFTSIGMAPHNGKLGLTLFVQTYLFVTHNKVITAQYFTWYLCLLPLCNASGGFLESSRIVRASTLLIVSILLWLGSAYGLEMQGLPFHRIVWLASVLYFFANVNMVGALLEFMGSDAEKKCSKVRVIAEESKKNQ